MVDINMGIINSTVCTSEDYKDAIVAIKIAINSGVKKIVITSDYCSKEGSVSSYDMKERVEKLRGMLDKENVNISLYYAQNIKLTRDVLFQCMDRKLCSINDTKYMLVDLGDTMTDEQVDMVFELTIREITPIIAHPERYQEIREKIGRIEKLKEIGCLLQLDINSLEGAYGNEVKKIAKNLLKLGEYSFVATEKINKNKDNTRHLKNLLSKSQQDIFKKNGFKLLRNEDIVNVNNSNKKRRGIFNFN